ncbi:MAG: cobaltochelatase subunit CobN, partial [Aquihabitans sp.]
MIVFLTTAATEVLALRTASEDLPEGFPNVRAGSPYDVHIDLDATTCVLVRLLGGRRAWESGFDELRLACIERGIPFLAFAGEAIPDAELTTLSTVPASLVAECFDYLVQGGPANLANLVRFVADTVLLEGFGFDAPVVVPDVSVWRSPERRDPTKPLVGVVFYRAHLVAGNTQFIADLCDEIEAQGADAMAISCYSLRGADGAPAVELLQSLDVDVLVTTVFAAGGIASAAGTDGGPGGLDGEAWEVSALAALDVPIIQAPSCTTSSANWAASDGGLAPFDVTQGVTIPEFDGRIIAPAFAFAEVVDDGDDTGSQVKAYRTIPDRVARVAGIAMRHARLRARTPAQRKVVIVLSAYPTKRSRLGNAVGLDTPASAIRMLHALRDAGYVVDRIPATSDELMAELADGLVYEAERLTPAEIVAAVGSMPADDYVRWFETIPTEVQEELEAKWGPAPGQQRVHDNALVFSGVDLGNVLVVIQPPRGYGDDPVAVYHSPVLPPAHHYLAFYRWLDEGWDADAIVHLGKHGTLEWLPGKAVGLSASCYPDLALGDVPFFYPFVVNDPGEGTQAKRRSHATVIDHLLPPMTRADTYDDLARLEQLFDEYAQLQSLDPSKLPTL